MPDDAGSMPISVTMFVDKDLDGKLDSNEPWKDVASGNYGSFLLLTGKCMLRLVVPSGWMQTAPAAGTGRIGTVVAHGVTNLSSVGLHKIT